MIDGFYVSKTEDAYLLMSLIDGGDLNENMKLYHKQDPNTVQDTVNKVFNQVIAGVRAMHSPTNELRCGIMHHDLKPPNIMIDSGVVKIADFDQATADATSVKYRVGSPGFLAPGKTSKYFVPISFFYLRS